jgi:hypothetical protein
MRRSKPLALRAALVGGMCSGVLAAMIVVCLALPASPSAATIATTTSADALSDYGSSTVHVPFSQVYAFSVVCSALPCRITLTESAVAGGQHIAGLDIATGAPVIMNAQPSAGPEPHCTEEEEQEALSSGTCPKKEAWVEKKSQDIYAVWFVPSEFNHTRLGSTLKRYGSVTLHVTGTLTDATGKRVVATRTITLRPAEPRPEPKPHKPSPPSTPTQTQRAQTAVVNELKRTYKIGSDDEEVYCNRVTTSRYKCSWSGDTVTAEGTFVSLSGEYSYCESPHGTALVVFYSDGTEVAISFSGRYNACDYPYS